MSVRFVETRIWDEDWFIELGMEYQHFWKYITDNCNHAGIWKPNKSGFEMRTKTKVNLDSFFQKVNGDKERILKLRDGDWFITGFIQFQWFNKKGNFDLVLSNKLHSSIWEELKKHGVPVQKVRGLQEVLETSRVKDKEKDNTKKKSSNVFANCYQSGAEAFKEIQSDEQMVERLLRSVQRSGFNSCNEITLIRAVKHFITVEEAKPDFTRRPRDEVKNHLVNWCVSKAKTLNQYAG